MIKKYSIVLVLVLFACSNTFSQNPEPHPFDFGKMWTFENPPKEWFKEAYNFDPGQEWFDDVRKSSLRFATWCSASFISKDGLIMTNHHCSRDVVGPLQKDGENFDKQGFYAATFNDERKADGLFVEQLIKTADITQDVNDAMDFDASDPEFNKKKAEVLDKIKAEYEGYQGWNNLRLQIVTYYSGGKYSLYGYKRFDDIRLVWIPEVDLGFFGGDPDNFTYPRYNLDCTFWRAYDENGQPLNTSGHYLEFNPKGADEGDAVFVVGNPGSTERYRTLSQLEYDRDIRYPMTYKFLKNRNDIMVAEYEELVRDPAKEFEAQALLNQIAGVANGMKAYGGIVKGLRDRQLYGRKIIMENHIRTESPGVNEWDDLTYAYIKLKPHGWAITHLAPSPMRGPTTLLLSNLYNYEKALTEGGLDSEKEKEYKDRIIANAEEIKSEKSVMLLKLWLQEIFEDIYSGDRTFANLMDGRKIDEYVSYLLANSKLTSAEDATDFLEKDITAEEDEMLRFSRLFMARYYEAREAFVSSSSKRKELEQVIAKQTFKVWGSSLSPDATFTLRISDGVVKGYEYNGTKAPSFTTFFGLYDRHYSHGKKFPWALPERWQNPPMELLQSKMNMVSTNDIIGGNSGSPLINKKGEAVGLIFDGNIESLPGNFIFDEESNRTVSIHAEGIYNALKYIFKADRIIDELNAR